MSEELKNNIAFTPEYLARVDHWAQQATTEALLAEEEANILKETGKDLLASLMTEIAIRSPDAKISETSLERQARTMPRWETHRNGQFAAMRKAVDAMLRLRNAERHWATIQSGLSYRKQEMARISG